MNFDISNFASNFYYGPPSSSLASPKIFNNFSMSVFAFFKSSNTIKKKKGKKVKKRKKERKESEKPRGIFFFPFLLSNAHFNSCLTSSSILNSFIFVARKKVKKKFFSPSFSIYNSDSKFSFASPSSSPPRQLFD